MKFLLLLFVIFATISCSQREPIIKRVHVFENPNIPPKDCTIWFDGCNKCSASNGHILACTKMACFESRPKKCLKFTTGLSKEDQAKKDCKAMNGVWQRKLNGKWICMHYTSDHNISCQTSKDCEGLCLYYPNKPTGFCSRHTPFVGCAHEFQRGKHFEVCE